MGTDEDWVVGVIFADESTFSLGENDRMILDEPMTERSAIYIPLHVGRKTKDPISVIKLHHPMYLII